MQEKTILKFSVIVIIIGLSFLFLYAGEIDFDVMDTIEEIPAEEKVKIQGRVSSLSVTDKVTFIKIIGSKPIITDVILFPEEDIYLKEGHYVEITGVVENYNGKKEIIAEEIKIK